MTIIANEKESITRTKPYWLAAVGSEDIVLAADDGSVAGIDNLCAQEIVVGHIGTVVLVQLIDGTIVPYTTERILACGGVLVGQFKKILLTGAATENGVTYTTDCYDFLVGW